MNRPTKLMADTPSMQWADHVEASRASKLKIAGIAIASIIALGAGLFLLLRVVL